MIKKYRNIILTNVSIIGFGLNNVKAVHNNGKLSIKIDNKDYTLEANKIENIAAQNSIEKLLLALQGAKEDIKDNDNKKVAGDITKDLYFVKSIEPGEGSTGTEIKMDDKFAITLTATKQAKIELVSKRKCIDFDYTDKKQLKKEEEDKLLEKVIQGEELSKIIGDDSILFDNKTSTLNGLALNTAGKIIGKDVKVLDENNKIKFKIDSGKIKAGKFKTVVCKFGTGVEEKLVAGLDLEKLCVEGNALNDKTSTQVFTKLNSIPLTSENVKVFFKDSVKSKINCNGTTIINESAKTAASNDNFIVIDNIVEDDINPIFLKKTFKVEFDNAGNGDKKVNNDILETIKSNLKTEFGDKVAFSVQDIINNIKAVTTSGDLPSAIFKDDAFTNLKNVTIKGVNTASNAELKNDNKVNSSVITIKIKEAAFAEGVVKTEIKITCNLDNVKKGGNKLKEDVKNNIFSILNRTLTEATTIDAIITELNTKLDGKFADSSKKIAATDIVFTDVSTNGNITKSGDITIKNDFVNKLKDDCFETPAKPKGGKESGSSNGDEQKGDNNKGRKGCSGSGKKNK